MPNSLRHTRRHVLWLNLFFGNEVLENLSVSLICQSWLQRVVPSAIFQGSDSPPCCLNSMVEEFLKDEKVGN